MRNLQELGAKYGIDFNSMNEKGYESPAQLRQDGACDCEADLRRWTDRDTARLSFRKDDNDQLQLVPHFVRNEPKLDVAYKAIPSLQRTRRTCCRTATSERLWISPTRIQVSCVLISSVSTVSPMRLLTSRPTRCAYPIPSARHLLPRTTRECSTQVFRFARRLSLPTGASLHRCCRWMWNSVAWSSCLAAQDRRKVRNRMETKKQTADKQEQKAEGDAGGQKSSKIPTTGSMRTGPSADSTPISEGTDRAAEGRLCGRQDHRDQGSAEQERQRYLYRLRKVRLRQDAATFLPQQSRPQTGKGTDSDQREQGTSRRQRAGQDPWGDQTPKDPLSQDSLRQRTKSSRRNRTPRNRSQRERQKREDVVAATWSTELIIHYNNRHLRPSIPRLRMSQKTNRQWRQSSQRNQA